MVNAEHEEAEGEKQRVAGEANQCGFDAMNAHQSEGSVPEPIAGNFSVQQRVAFNDWVIMDEPEPQQQPQEKGGEGGLGGMAQQEMHRL